MVLACRATCRLPNSFFTFAILNPERHSNASMFFAQREAIETAIWLNEVAEKPNAGTHILSRLAEARAVVMAALIPPII